MAKLLYKDKKWTNSEEIAATLAAHGIPYERWGTRADTDCSDDQVLELYASEVNQLKQTRGYVTADLIALNPDTPNLDTICSKFDKEHHHSEDEVRFVVAGEGVFEIKGEGNDFFKFTAEPGDLIVIPKDRRHLFYLTSEKRIRCIRLFKDPAGWEAIYEA